MPPQDQQQQDRGRQVRHDMPRQPLRPQRQHGQEHRMQGWLQRWSGQSLADVRHELTSHLRTAGIGTAALDARLLVQQATGLSHACLIAEERTRRLTTDEARILIRMAVRRLQGEPVSRIIGLRAFFGRDFVISPDVLDPRPETELLVEAALKLRPHVEALHDESPLLCDAGAGSGCIIVSLLAEWPAAQGMALDISAAALAITRHNAARHGVAERLHCVRANWLAPVRGPVDLLVSNPPYLKAAEMQCLPPEVRHDPALALAAGEDGFAAYRALARKAADVLRPGGWLLLEVGAGQAEEVRRMFEQAGLRPDSLLPPILHDLAGIGRVVALRRDGR